MSLTIHAADVVLPICADPIRDGAVAVDGQRIVAVGARADVVEAHPGVRVRTWPGVLLPGLINAHTHLQYSYFADLADGSRPFFAWIRELTRRRGEFDDARWAESTRYGLHQAVQRGTTGIADIVTDVAALAPTARAGLSGVSFLEAVGADEQLWRDKRRDALLTALASGPRGVHLGISPHTLYTLGTSVFADCVALARERGMRIHTHLAETAEESEYVLAGGGPYAEWADRIGLAFELAGEGSGLSPAHHLDTIGGLGPDVAAAHGVHLDADERALLRERGTSVVLCVRSNALLKAGEPPVADYLREASPIAIGTDSLASCPDLDLLREGGAVRDLARTQGYDAPDLAARVITAATAGGAASLGRDDLGVLRAGARADLAAFDVSVPDGADPYAVLLADGPDRCVATIIGGTIVHRRQGGSRPEPASA